MECRFGIWQFGIDVLGATVDCIVANRKYRCAIGNIVAGSQISVAIELGNRRSSICSFQGCLPET